MSRPRIEPMLAVLLVGFLLPSFGRVAGGQDRAASWLEARGMYELLQIHLEQGRAEAADDPARPPRPPQRRAQVGRDGGDDGMRREREEPVRERAGHVRPDLGPRRRRLARRRLAACALPRWRRVFR